MRKKILMLLTLTACVLSVFGQDRTEKAKAQIKNETISDLNTATGWMLNPDEEWLSLKNTIPVSMESEFKSLIEYEKKGLGIDNFKYYELKEIQYKDSTYYVLIKEYRDGYYKYKSIEEDWNELISYSAYVFAKSELSKLDNIEDGRANMIEIDLIDDVNVKWKSESEAIDLIETKIDWNKPEDEKSKLIFHIAPYKDKEIVQFQIYTTFSKYNIIGGIIKEHKPKGVENSWSTKQVYLTDELFKHCYFETDYDSFNNFLNLE